ncbi:MAG: SDR family oxidoreductase [Saccharofermentans sp.]|nr:SDR family oxidoreductase [Saccharofermentans sp.]
MYQDKYHVLVSGGSRGIGAGIVKYYSERGYAVSYFYKNAPGPVGDNILPIQCDVTDESMVNDAYAKVIDAFGAPEYLVYCSGISLTGLSDTFVYDDYRRVMDTNFGGFFLLANKVIPSMVHNHFGGIVAISSMWGQVGASCEALYSSSKGAIDAYVKSLAKELGPSGIRVNAVSPGVIDTDMMKEYSDEDKAALIDETPLMRMGTPDDVAAAVYYLTSGSSSFITGQILGVNGGFLI